MPVRDLGAEERERRRVEREVAGERREPVAPPERGGERLLGDRADLEQVRPEPAAEDDLVLERARGPRPDGTRVLHEELAEAGGTARVYPTATRASVEAPHARPGRVSFAGIEDPPRLLRRQARPSPPRSSTMDRPVATDAFTISAAAA